MAIPILSDIFGQKPQIAGFQDVILGDEQIRALLADLKAFPQIEQLGNLWQNYMLAGIEHAVPGFGGLLSGITGTTQEELKQAGDLMKGIIPEDVMSNTFRSGAMQNLLSGLGGSPIGSANQARQLGLTSLDMINQGANLLGNASQRWGQLASFGQSTLAPIQQMLITPQQQAAQTESNRLIQRQIQQERFNVAAAPDPVMKGLSDIVMYLTGQYLGHGMGGGGGLPQAGNSAAVGATNTLPAGGMGGGYSPMPGQSYDPSKDGVGVTAQYNAPAFYGGGGSNVAAYPMSSPATQYAAPGVDPFSPVAGGGFNFGNTYDPTNMSGFGQQWDPYQMNLFGG